MCVSCEVSTCCYLSVLIRRGSPRTRQVPVAVKGLSEDGVVRFLGHGSLHTHTHTHDNDNRSILAWSIWLAFLAAWKAER